MITSVRFTLALLALALAGYALYSLITHEVPATNRDALMVALGIILGLSKDAFGFFFQSSQSSADKNTVIAGMTGQASGKADVPVNIVDGEA